MNSMPRTVSEIYAASDGEATRALYADLETRGPVGVVALNLFRAQKCSSRAKVYRGGIPGKGSYRGMAYDRKGWSLQNLCAVLGQHAPALGLVYGWGRDERQTLNPWVLYLDLPQGQVSFHSPVRYAGPDYPGAWDGVHQSEPRILAFVADVRGE